MAQVEHKEPLVHGVHGEENYRGNIQINVANGSAGCAGWEMPKLEKVDQAGHKMVIKAYRDSARQEASAPQCWA